MSGAAPTTIRTELELAPGVWTDVSTDVVQADQIRLSYGIRGSGPLDRVADTGTALFSLRNDAANAAGVQGAYSPNHVDARPGFTYGTRVRFAIDSAGTTYYKWRGRLVEIDPVPGPYGLQRTRCRAVDWMEDLATFNLRGVTAQQDQRADELLTTLVDAMPAESQPAARVFDAGRERYPYALYDIGGGSSGRSVAQKLMQSELGHLAVIGDQTQGGTLRFWNRHHRATADPAVTLDETMHGLRVPSTLDHAFNRVRVSVHPVRVDAAPTVLFALETASAESRPLIRPGETREFWGEYVDPANEDQVIGGTHQVPPEAHTDYAANSQQDGMGRTVTDVLEVRADFFAGSVKFTVRTTSDQDVYLTRLQCRGSRIVDVAPVVFEATSVQGYGDRSLQLDMPYQVDANIGQGVADYLHASYHSLASQMTQLSLAAHTSDTLMTQALAREPGDRIAVTETGVTAVEAFIQGVNLTVGPGTRLDATWHLAPASDGDFWILDDPVASLLGVSTVLGYA